MRRFKGGRRKSREPREEGQARTRQSPGMIRGAPQCDVPADQPACLVCDDDLIMGPSAEVGG